MSIEQLEVRPELGQAYVPDITGQDILPCLIAQAAARKVAEQRRQDILFNLSGEGTGVCDTPRDRRSFYRSPMRYNVAND